MVDLEASCCVDRYVDRPRSAPPTTTRGAAPAPHARDAHGDDRQRGGVASLADIKGAEDGGALIARLRGLNLVVGVVVGVGHLVDVGVAVLEDVGGGREGGGLRERRDVREALLGARVAEGLGALVPGLGEGVADDVVLGDDEALDPSKLGASMLNDTKLCRASGVARRKVWGYVGVRDKAGYSIQSIDTYVTQKHCRTKTSLGTRVTGRRKGAPMKRCVGAVGIYNKIIQS